MKRKKSTSGKTVRRLVALSAAAATMWTVGQTADWDAVAHSGTQLIQSAAWAERLVRQELIRPLEEGSSVVLTGWEELVVAQSPALLLQRAALKEEGSLDSDPGQTKREQAAESAKEQKKEETKTAQKKTTKAKQKEKKSAKATKKLDTSKLKVADINLDNHTKGIQVNLKDYFDKKLNLTLQPAKKGPQILIVHTHTTEAYTKGKKDKYEETDPARTLNNDYNMVRVGEEMKKVFEDMGLSVIHDTSKHDYPSYNGSYAHALNSIEKYVKKYPTIQVVLDVHRDAIIDSKGVSYAKRTKVNGESVAQVMLVVGTNDMGLSHPKWKDHLTLAVQMQKKMLAIDKSFPRPIDLRSPRFNGHATPGSMLVEVGTSGNTLQEALAGARYFARAAGGLYTSCVKK